MKQVKFLEVGMENFCIYKEPMIIPIRDNSLCMLVGPNGVGKTTIFVAIPFTLYGETIKKMKVEEVINNDVGKNCHTWVKFTVDGELYIVDRYLKYTKIGSTVHLSDKNGNVIKKGQKEVLPEVEKLIMPSKLFTNTLLFGQKVNSFFTDLTDSSQKEIFRMILNLSEYILYQKEASKLLSSNDENKRKIDSEVSLNKGLADDSSLQIERLEENRKKFLENKDSKINELKQGINNTKEEILKIKIDEKEYSKINSELQKTIVDITNVNNELSTIKKDRDSKLDEIELKKATKKSELENSATSKKAELEKNKNNKCNEIRENYYNSIEPPLRDKISSIDKKVSNIENEKTKKEVLITSLNEKISDYKNNIINKEVSECPTCATKIDDKKKNHLLEHIKEFEEQISVLTSEIDVLSKSRVNLENDKSKVEEQIKNEKKKVDEEVKKEINLFNEEYEKVDNKLESVLETLDEMANKKIAEEKSKTDSKEKELNEKLTNKQKTKNDLESKITMFEEDRKEISRLQNEISVSEKQIEDTKESKFDDSQISYYKKKIKDVKDKNKKLEESKKELIENDEIFDFWKTGFSSSGIPSMLIDDSIPFMNEKVTEYLDKICHGRYTVSFDTMKEVGGEFKDKISVNVFDNQSHANSRGQLSGGQSRIVDIATILTLSDLQSNIQDVSFNLLLFDEVFDSLDDTNINYVAKLLKILCKEKSVCVVSHNHINQIETDEIMEFFD